MPDPVISTADYETVPTFCVTHRSSHPLYQLRKDQRDAVAISFPFMVKQPAPNIDLCMCAYAGSRPQTANASTSRGADGIAMAQQVRTTLMRWPHPFL